MSTQPSTPGKHHHLVLATFATFVLLAVYLVINAPSAATSDFNKSDEARPDNVQNQFISDKSPSQTIQVESDTSLSDSSLKKDSAEPAVIQPLKFQPLMAIETAFSASTDVAHASKTTLYNAPETTKPEQNEHLQLQPSQAQPWISVTIKKGDTLSQLFTQNDLPATVAYGIAALDEAKPLLNIRPGKNLKLKKTMDGELGLLHYPLNQFETLILQPVDNSFQVETLVREPEVRINNAKATIYNSLLGAASEADISTSTMYDFIAMFGWQVDFAMDLRDGDQFSIIYEELFLDDKKVGDGTIIAAELLLSDRKLQAVRHTDENGDTHYYAPDGSGVKGTFLRSPLKFANITSNYSKNRLHPIKKIWRAHKGVDYGAPRGTPIMATGDGTVKVSGRKSGYGKIIIVRHGGKYDTVYAHLNGYAKDIRPGARVKQGQVIGYVGSTGLATGPHLHYEFRINGVHKNPVTVELPKSEPIDKKYTDQFKQRAKIWVAELDHLNRIPLAQNESGL